MSVHKANVVCVTYNNAETIEAMMVSLSKQADKIQALVIRDNGSADATASIVESKAVGMPFPVALLRGENVGFAAGIQSAGQHPVIDEAAPTLCINPDLELANEVLPLMLECVENMPAVGVVTAPLVGLNGEADSASVRKLPSLGMASVYALLGRFTPRSLRYNRVEVSESGWDVAGSSRFREIEATTGALMLVHPKFRSAVSGLFDTDYWMYGEDLQLCRDAHSEGWRVVMLDARPSLHVKGVSSGWPRSSASNRAFHDAMRIYYDKNLANGGIQDVVVHVGISLRHALTRLSARFAPANFALARGRA